MPPGEVDQLEVQHPGYLDMVLEDWSAEIDARLTKRYTVPFSAGSPPRVIQRWLCSLVTREAYLKLGVSPNSAQDELLIAQAEKAEANLLEAADAQNGLFGLPLRDDARNTSGVSKGRPKVRSDKSPYDWLNNQGRD